MLFMVCVALAAAYSMSRHLFDPLHTLAEGFQKLKSQDFSRLWPPGKGEFKEVFENYNKVSEEFLKIKIKQRVS